MEFFSRKYHSTLGLWRILAGCLLAALILWIFRIDWWWMFLVPFWPDLLICYVFAVPEKYFIGSDKLVVKHAVGRPKHIPLAAIEMILRAGEGGDQGCIVSYRSGRKVKQLLIDPASPGEFMLCLQQEDPKLEPFRDGLWRP
jgi:hypothetical protein